MDKKICGSGITKPCCKTCKEEKLSLKDVIFLPSDVASLRKKLQLLVGEFIAGNNTTSSQIYAILNNLKQRREIGETEYN